jgi:hypothetical protein
MRDHDRDGLLRPMHSHSANSPQGWREWTHRQFHQLVPDRSTGSVREASTGPPARWSLRRPLSPK